MSMYLKKPAGSLSYVLSAVLIHCGHSAYSGHYVGKFCSAQFSEITFHTNVLVNFI
jgi:uncharacterized UBP type Zn finger protein